MAEDITFVHFRYGTYAEINNSANNRTLNPHAVYIATDKQLMYAKGAWIGVTSVTSEVNQDTGEITLKFNYDSEGQPTGNPITCPIKGAGMTTEQKAQLATAYNFVIDIAGTSADDVINKWQEVVDFLAGIEGGTLESIVATKADKNTTIIAGDGLTGGGDLSENRTIKVESANDGITVNSDNIQLNTVDNLTTPSKTKPLSANQGKVLDGKVKSVADLLNDMFEKITENGKTYIKTKYGFASEQFVSAGGTDDTESGGSGGANLSQMWESLQTNNDTFKDRFINVAHIPTLTVDHIPTLTTGKISDFVAATQAIADNAVANKAEKATTLEGYGIKDAVKLINNSADDVRNTSAGFAHISQGTKWGGGLWTVFSSDKTAGIQINVNAWANKTLATRIYNNSTGTWYDWHEVAFKETTLSGYGITDAVTLNTDQTISGAKTFSNLKVSNTNLVTNLNADELDGLHKDGFQQAAYTYFPLSQGADIANTTTLANIIANNKTGDKDNFKFYDTKFFSSASSTSTRAQIAYGYAYDNIHFRRYYDGEWTNWKQLVFTDSDITGNAASATKLKTARKIWGQNFNGTADVIGRMTNVTSIENPIGLSIVSNGLSFTPEKAGDLKSALVIGGSIDYGLAIWGHGSGKCYLQVGRTDGINVAYDLILQHLGGNVGVGTNDPTEKLHVQGNIYSSGSVRIDDAKLTYDIGTLTVDKALKTTSTLTAPQGIFSNYIKIGNATISWNPKGYLEINEGLASHKFISAGGVVTGDAGGGGGGLSLTDMWVSLNGNIDAYGESKIHIDHIPLDVILSHDSYENDVARRINTFNYSNSSSFTSAVKALIVADNIPTLEMSKIEGLVETFNNISTVVQSNFETLNTLITNNHNDHEARIKAIEQALTWQTV